MSANSCAALGSERAPLGHRAWLSRLTIRGDDVHLSVVMAPQIVQQQVMGRLDADHALGRFDAQSLTLALELGKPGRGMRNHLAGDGRPGRVDKTDIMLLGT